MGTTYAEEQNKEALRNATFLQGVAASAIAFALHEAPGWHSLLSLVPAAASAVAFGLSFYFGILYSHAVQRFYMIGAVSAEGSLSPTEKAAVIQRRKLAKRTTGTRYRWQLRCLLAGAVLYFVATGVNVQQTWPKPTPAPARSSK